MQKKCEKCGGYRFKKVDNERIKCRKCGDISLKDHIKERQLKQFREDCLLESLEELSSFAR